MGYSLPHKYPQGADYAPGDCIRGTTTNASNQTNTNTNIVYYHRIIIKLFYTLIFCDSGFKLSFFQSNSVIFSKNASSKSKALKWKFIE